MANPLPNALIQWHIFLLSPGECINFGLVSITNQTRQSAECGLACETSNVLTFSELVK